MMQLIIKMLVQREYKEQIKKVVNLILMDMVNILLIITLKAIAYFFNQPIAYLLVR